MLKVISVPDRPLGALYARLEEVLGAAHAETLMSRLPPMPDDLATKADLLALGGDTSARMDRLEQRFDHLEQRFDHLERRFDRLEDRFDRIEDAMLSYLRTFVVATTSAMTGLTAIFGVMLAVFR